jgi:hypothetical protein
MMSIFGRPTALPYGTNWLRSLRGSAPLDRKRPEYMRFSMVPCHVEIGLDLDFERAEQFFYSLIPKFNRELVCLSSSSMPDTNPTVVQLPTGDHSNTSPIILIHDGSGMDISYQLLEDLNRPVYSIRDPSFEDPEKIWKEGLREMATLYIEMIRTVLPKGEILLGGKKLIFDGDHNICRLNSSRLLFWCLCSTRDILAA